MNLAKTAIVTTGWCLINSKKGGVSILLAIGAACQRRFLSKRKLEAYATCKLEAYTTCKLDAYATCKLEAYATR